MPGASFIHYRRGATTMPEESKQYQNGSGEHGGERDHRVLGRELGIFMYSSAVGAGLPLWLYKTSGHWYKYRDSIYPPMIVREQEDAPNGEPSGWHSSLDSCCGNALSVGGDEDVPDDAYILRPMNCP